ncbi:hypothetical protein O9992_05160 [Vibrio lentus]|nr:hypothetical protein [Vibrio lentus]
MHKQAPSYPITNFSSQTLMTTPSLRKSALKVKPLLAAAYIKVEELVKL